MTIEDRLLFACTRQAFAESHREMVHTLCRAPVNWDALYATADTHAVTPLIYSNLQKCDPGILRIPDRVADQFETGMYRNVIAKTQIAARTAQVLAYLDHKRQQVMLVKGAALDVRVYQQPWYTVANDVDLLLYERPGDLEVQSFLNALGRAPDIQFEYDFYGHHDISINGILPVNFDRVWADAIEIPYRETRVKIMSAEDMLIASCINSCRKRLFRLKSLCDIAEIINTRRDIDWEVFVEKAVEYQSQRIVYAALYAVQISVGCRLDPAVYERLRIHPARARVIRELCDRQSFSSLHSLFSGAHLLHRPLNLALVTPYAAYTPGQTVKKIRFVLSNP